MPHLATLACVQNKALGNMARLPIRLTPKVGLAGSRVQNMLLTKYYLSASPLVRIFYGRIESYKSVSETLAGFMAACIEKGGYGVR